MLRPKFTVNPKELAHWRLCHETLYIIYGSSLRDFCHECTEEMKEDYKVEDQK